MGEKKTLVGRWKDGEWETNGRRFGNAYAVQSCSGSMLVYLSFDGAKVQLSYGLAMDCPTFAGAKAVNIYKTIFYDHF